MTESGKILHQLKVATNYSKLAFHKDGPRSFKRGQGAVVKVAYKFGKDGVISFRKLCRILGWECEEVRETVKIAQENGYVTVGKTAKGKNAVCLTEKGFEVVAKRMAAEDRAADEIMAGITPDEREQLMAITEKIISNCQGMGVDYRVIRVKRNGQQGRIAEYGGQKSDGKKSHCRKHGHSCKRAHGKSGKPGQEKQADKKGHHKGHGKKSDKKASAAGWKGKGASYCKKVCKEDAEKCKCYQKHRRAHCKGHRTHK